MTWRSITQDEMLICQRMRTWIETARKWQYDPSWLPTDADIAKSALFERLMNSLEPLDEPPPLGLSCPWYAVVEDRGPHYVFDTYRCEKGSFHGEDTICALQNPYKIIEERGAKDFVVRDGRHETSYRFHLWFDPDWRHPNGHIIGGWFLQNLAFEV